MGNTLTRTKDLTDRLQLSLIYTDLLKSLYALAYNKGSSTVMQNHSTEALNLVNESFSSAIRYLNQRCQDCDSSNIKLICYNCDPRPNE